MAILNKSIIIREPKKGKSDYTPISNSILQSSQLTPNEKSILVHLLSLPKNFAILKGNIWRKMNIGRDAFNKAWKGLEKAGHCKSERIMDNGLLKGWLHIISEVPMSADSDLLKFSNSEIQIFGNSVNIQKKEYTKEGVDKRSIRKKSTSIPGNSIPVNAESLKGKSYQELYEMGIEIDANEYINLK